MSLHAQLSPEAEARLAQQRRNTTISSLIIALLSIALLVAILFVFKLKIFSQDPEPMVSYSAPAEEELKPENKRVTTQIQKKPSSASNSRARVLVANTESPVSVPVVEDFVIDPATDFGSGEDFGDGLGDGDGTGAGNSGAIPSSLRKRCSLEDRLERLKDAGGKPECEDAVVKTLDWLQQTQNKNGSWTSDSPVAMTGLALLTYLGHCEHPKSEKYGKTVLDGITYLINVSMKNNGKLAHNLRDRHWCYEHAIATYALAEAYTLSNGFGSARSIPNFKKAVEDAGNFIIKNQSTSGSWAYAYDISNQGDNSIGGWHMQALKACKHTGIKFPKIRKSVRQGIAYMQESQKSDGALPYHRGQGINREDNGATLAAVGALSFQIHGKGRSKGTRNAIRLIIKEMDTNYDSVSYDLYGHYYAAQVMINAGGSDWTKFNNSYLDKLLASQNDDGSWSTPSKNGKSKAPVTRWIGGHNYSVHYRTCLAALILETYYRFLPATGSNPD